MSKKNDPESVVRDSTRLHGLGEARPRDEQRKLQPHKRLRVRRRHVSWNGTKGQTWGTISPGTMPLSHHRPPHRGD